MGDMNLKICDMGKEGMVLRYAVPFFVALHGSYRLPKKTRENACYERMSRLFEQSRAFRVAEKPRHESDAYEYIVESLLKDDEKNRNPGKNWTFDLKSLPAGYLNEQGQMTFRFRNKGNQKEMLVHMSDLGVYYFRTNVGILWYELQLGDGKEAMDLEDIVYFQNKIKELHRADGTQLLLGTEGEKPKKYESGKLLAQILEDLLAGDQPDPSQPHGEGKLALHFFDPSFTKPKNDAQGNEIRPAREVPDKAIMFSYLLLDETEDSEQHQQAVAEDAMADLEKAAYYFSNGYTSKYHISAAVRERMYEPFEGCRWFATRDGAGYFALRSEDNQIFYGQGLAGKIRVDYFLFFILALHQSYALNNYQRRITQELSANPDSYLDEGVTGQKMEHLLSEINVFSMKSIYMSVSHVQHQNDFFEYLQSRLQVKEDMESLSLGIESLTELSRLQKEDSEKENEKKMNALLGIISLLTVISALTDGVGLLGIYKEGLSDPGLTQTGFWARFMEMVGSNPWYYGILAVFHVLLIAIFGYSLVRIVHLKSEKKDKN
ncbi:MAG: hypothetical protein K5682_03845 [Lachnospiraceae bacterium]|nr:hypothetical protein [Lachnospiraceae bacterium]